MGYKKLIDVYFGFLDKQRAPPEDMANNKTPMPFAATMQCGLSFCILINSMEWFESLPPETGYELEVVGAAVWRKFWHNKTGMLSNTVLSKLLTKLSM